MDDGMVIMANWAGNKAPGERKRSRQPRSYQELCSISGPGGSRHATAINMPPDRNPAPKTRTPAPITPETLGQCSAAALRRRRPAEQAMGSCAERELGVGAVVSEARDAGAAAVDGFRSHFGMAAIRVVQGQRDVGGLAGEGSRADRE